jgi:hypothetical protein
MIPNFGAGGDRCRRLSLAPNRHQPGSLSAVAILRRLRHRSVVQGQQELPFWLASRQNYTTGQTPQQRICCGTNRLSVEAEGHLNAPIELSEHPSPLSDFLKLRQPI